MTVPTDYRWLRLLVYFNDRSYARTFPFILGALRNPIGSLREESESVGELNALLTVFGMADAMGYRVRISRCDQISELVAGIDASIYDSGDDPSRNRISFVSGLWEEIRNPVMSGRFSFHKTDKAYHPFTADDLIRIAEALQRRLRGEA